MNANTYKAKMLRLMRGPAQVREQMDCELALARMATERGDAASAKDHAIKRVVLKEILDEMLTPCFL